MWPEKKTDDEKAAAWLLLLVVVSCWPDTREFNPGKEVLLYSYFKGNGDGLHLAYSTDGYRWKALNNDKIFLEPRVGEWLVYFDKYTGHAMGAVASADREKWTDISTIISFPKGMRPPE